MAKTLRYWELLPWYGKVSKKHKTLRLNLLCELTFYKAVHCDGLYFFTSRTQHNLRRQTLKEPPLYLLSLQRQPSVDATLHLLLPFLPHCFQHNTSQETKADYKTMDITKSEYTLPLDRDLTLNIDHSKSGKYLLNLQE